MYYCYMIVFFVPVTVAKTDVSTTLGDFPEDPRRRCRAHVFSATAPW